MCVIVHQPAGTALTVDQAKQMQTANPDGLGIMLYDPSTGMETHKFPKPSIRALTGIVRAIAGYETVIHFRYATHGDIRESNTHPFPVAPGIWCAHNGILDPREYSLDCGDGTDTEAYIKRYIRPLLDQCTDPIAAVHSESVCALIESHVGSNKLAIMTGDGRVTVYNRRRGEWVGKLWVSNTYWMPRSMRKGIAYGYGGIDDTREWFDSLKRR